MARPSKYEPQPRACPFCDFSRGTRGMDRCAKCDGTGSIFMVPNSGNKPGFFSFPNTEKGYNAALAKNKELLG